MKKIILFSLISCWCMSLFSQKLTREQYIKQYAPLAIEEMERTGIPASITLAQACLESSNGNSDLAVAANNHFGIKCHSSWKGKKIHKDDDEKDECFRVYSSIYESYKDHSRFLVNGKRYAFLFELNPTDYKKWAKGLRKAGYATNPQYPRMLIRIIEEHELYKYDNPEKYDIEPGSIEEEKTLADIFNFSRKPLENAPDPTVETPDLGELKPIENRFNKSIYRNNKTKCIFIQNEETIFTISQKFGIPVWKLYHFNDFEAGHPIENGDIIYLEKKRRQAEKPYYTHTVQKGENIRSISQLYGVRAKKIAKMNRRDIDDDISEGTNIYLRKNLIMFE
ncbi:MAG: glucosaminidase domain-containing protein [Bacteroidales bacterium]